MQRCILAILSLAFCAGAQAVSEDVQLNLVTTQGVGQTIGSVKITETDRGLEFAPTLRALPPGRRADITIRSIPANTKGRWEPGILATCPCWWSTMRA